LVALFVARFAHTPLDVIERWSPEKLLAYFETARTMRDALEGTP
jgi:hypothetical protein